VSKEHHYRYDIFTAALDFQVQELNHRLWANYGITSS
jgi:hypothetical protein